MKKIDLEEIRYKIYVFYKKSKIAPLYIILFFYILFLSSNFLLPDIINGNMRTVIGESQTFKEREFTLQRWEYNKVEQKMLVEIDVRNYALDGINSYTYTAMTRYVNLEVQQVLATDTLLVLEIINVPDPFGEIALHVGLDDGRKKVYYEDVCHFYNNDKTIDTVETLITYETEEEYLAARIDIKIKKYQTE